MHICTEEYIRTVSQTYEQTAECQMTVHTREIHLHQFGNRGKKGHQEETDDVAKVFWRRI
jgi:hypothetical protein